MISGICATSRLELNTKMSITKRKGGDTFRLQKISRCHPAAQIHRDAQLEGCVVGSGAHVDCAVQLTKCVVLPGAIVRDWGGRQVRQTIFSEESIFQC